MKKVFELVIGFILYFWKGLLVLAVLGICLWESYSPLPDFYLDRYKDIEEKTTKFSGQQIVPTEIALYLDIPVNKTSYQQVRNKYNIRGKGLEEWIKKMKLSKKEATKVLILKKYRSYE